MTGKAAATAATIGGVVVLVMGLLGAYALGSVKADDDEPMPASPRTIVMQGVGTVEGVPDQIEFDFSVNVLRPDATAALDQAGAVMKRVVAALVGKGIARKDIKTTGLSIEPEYRYPRNAAPVITGYRVDQGAQVLVRAFANGGAALATATNAGGNAIRMSGVRLKIGDRDSLLGAARADAVKQAKAKADEYAVAAAQQLGRVVDIREVPVAQPQPNAAYNLSGAIADAAAARAVPIEAGTQDLKVTVAVTWRVD